MQSILNKVTPRKIQVNKSDTHRTLEVLKCAAMTRCYVLYHRKINYWRYAQFLLNKLTLLKMAINIAHNICAILRKKEVPIIDTSFGRYFI